MQSLVFQTLNGQAVDFSAGFSLDTIALLNKHQSHLHTVFQSLLATFDDVGCEPVWSSGKAVGW